MFEPTGKGNKEAEANWAKAGQQWQARQPKDRVFRQQPQLLTKENSPGMGWKQRKSLNEQMLQNQQSGANARLQAQTSMATTRAANQTDLERARMTEETAAERNRIDAMNVQDQISGRALENQARQFTLNEQQQVDALRKRYLDPKTSPEEKKQLSEALRLFGKGDKGSGLRTFDTTVEDVRGN